ncbi:MAG: hypothetical protein ACYC0X_02850 [Pirellulaceae bacterium]
MPNRGLNWLVAAAVSIPLLWCFAAPLAGGRVFAYRDAAHFYYPLEAWISEHWSRGEVPLWNPQDGNGTPVIAETTSAVFYPGKLVFALPLPFEQRFVLYVVLHVVLAAWGAYRLARCANRNGIERAGPAAMDHAGPWPLGIPAAGLTAVAYAFGGAVLFQYSNVVFLVGAAWLPWTLLAMDHLVSERRFLWVLAVGLCLALIVLGGDPQTAYHAGLLGMLYAVLAGRAVAKRMRSEQVPWARYATVRALVRLAMSAVVAGLLAAVQIVPAWSWVGHSDRDIFTYPRSVYEVPGYFRRSRVVEPWERAVDAVIPPGSWAGVVRGIFGEPQAGEHHNQVYSFSVAPWRLVEMLWPNVTGRTFPQNRRWLSALGAEDRIWSPTLYLGILPLLLAAGTWRLRNAERRVQWFSWMLLLATVGSFGAYGLGFAAQRVQELFPGEPAASSIGEPVGGWYWCMVVALPGYAHFRYPAKWMVIATLALAVLAGVGLEQVLGVHRGQFMRRLRIVAALSVVASALVGLTRPWWATWFGGAGGDELFGPLSTDGAWSDAWTACGHTALVCGVAWLLLGRKGTSRTGLGVSLLLLTACEVAWANGWLILTAPSSSMKVTTVLDRTRVRPSGTSFYRWPSRAWVPDQWRTTASPSRATESLSWDNATLYAKLHLLRSHRSLLPQSTVASHDFRAFLGAGGRGVPHPAILDVLGAEQIILPDTYVPGASWGLEPEEVPEVPGVAVWRNPSAFPRAWVVHDVRVWPQFFSSDPQKIRRHFADLLFPDGRRRDLRRTAVIECECDSDFVLPAISGAVGPSAGESVSIRAASGCRVELEVVLSSPGLLVLNQLYDSRWRVQAGSEDRLAIPVVRTNRIMQGVFLPAGRHELVFRYVPWDLYAAGAISLASALVLSGVALWFAWVPRRLPASLNGMA